MIYTLTCHDCTKEEEIQVSKLDCNVIQKEAHKKHWICDYNISSNEFCPECVVKIRRIILDSMKQGGGEG